MSREFNAHSRSGRLILSRTQVELCTVGLLTLVSCLVGEAAEATLPNFSGNAISVQFTPGGSAPTFVASPASINSVFVPPTTLDVGLKAKSTIINWNGGFNIDAGDTVNFHDSRPAPSGNIAVLNRDLSPNRSPTLIYGNLNSDKNVAVYLINQNGFVFGPSALVNVGALVTSSLNFTSASEGDFLSGTYSSLHFMGPVPVNNVGQIILYAGSQIDTTLGSSNGLGQLVLVGSGVYSFGGRQIPNSGSKLTAGGDFAAVVGSDVTMTAPGSPLSFTIAQGANGSFFVAGTIIAQNAIIAIANAPGAVDSLLRVDATVTATGAALTDHGIVLAAGQSAPGVVFTGARGVSRIISPNLNLNSAKDVTLASVEMTAGGRISANGDIILTGKTVLQNDLSLTSPNGGRVQINGTVDSSISAAVLPSLSVVTNGTSTFGGAVGSVGPLSSLSVTGPSVLNASGITTTNGVSLAKMTIGASAPATVAIDAGAGALTFSGDLLAMTPDANTLVLNGSSISVGNVGVGGRLGSLTFNGTTGFSGDISAASAVTFNGGLTLVGPGVRSVAAGSASFQAIDASAPSQSSLAVATSGATSFNGAIGAKGALDGLGLRAASLILPATLKISTFAADIASGPVSVVVPQTLTIGTVGSISGVNAASGDVALTSTGATSDLIINQAIKANAGNVTLTSGHDVIGAVAGSVAATGVGNTVDVSAPAGQILLAGPVTADGKVSANAFNDLRLASANSSGGDVALLSRTGNVTLIGDSSAVDIALSAPAGTITTSKLTAQDDIVLRSFGSTNTGTLSSGNGVDVIGAGDALAGKILPGGSIDLAANGILIAGTARASGPKSDIRLNGGAGGNGSLAIALDLAAGHDIQINGAARGSTIIMNAGHDLTADALFTNVGDPGGNVSLTAGNLLTLNYPVTLGGDLTLQALDFAGVALNASMVGGHNLTIIDTGGGLTVGPLTAPGTLTLDVRNGGTLSVAGALASKNEDIVLLTSGGGDVLLKDSLTTGTAAPRFISINSSGSITQISGGITTNKLVGSAIGAANFNSAINRISQIAFTASGLALRDTAGGLKVSGAAATAGDVKLQLDGGLLDLAGDLSATGTATIIAGGADGSINQTGGRLVAASLTGNSTTGTKLNAPSNDIATLAGFTNSGAGGLSLADSRSLFVSGAVAAGSDDLALTAPGLNFTGQALTAGRDVTLTATGGQLVGGTVTGGRNITGTGKTIDVATALANAGTLALTANEGLLKLGTGTAGLDVALRSPSGSVQIGSATASRNLLVEGIEAHIATSAGGAEVQFTNLGTSAMRLGDGIGSNGFSLSQAEVNRISSPAVIFQSGTKDVEIGALALSNSVGSTTLAVLTTGRVDITGEVSTVQEQTNRTLRIGGDSGIGQASVIRVAATPTGGGRLLMGNSSIDLRGAKIGVGEDFMFLDTVGLVPGATPLSVARVASDFIGNPASSLYNPRQPYSNGTLLTANKLSVTYADYALFQNTASPGGVPSGAEIGKPGALQTLVLTSAGGSGLNGFALSGKINGSFGPSSALLGPKVIGTNGINPYNVRINGCQIDAAAECGISNVSSVSMLPINTSDIFNDFNRRAESPLSASNELPLTFDPLVGANNEALFAGVDSVEAGNIDGKCRNDGKTVPCAANKEDQP